MPRDALRSLPPPDHAGLCYQRAAPLKSPTPAPTLKEFRRSVCCPQVRPAAPAVPPAPMRLRPRHRIPMFRFPAGDPAPASLVEST